MGCVVLRKLDSLPFAAECKRLYVQPIARGHGIADKLLDTQENFARDRGLRWIYLDSYDDFESRHSAVSETRVYFMPAF